MTTDHLGSARVITNENGAVSSRRDYTAFGEESITAERHEDLGYTGSGDGVRKGYTGYEKDTESGLDFAQARYYNSVHGRFTSVDPLTASASIRNPQTFNRYSYVLNSPYKYVDPLGLIARSAIAGTTEADGLDRRWTTKDCTKGCAIDGKWYEPVDFQNSPPPEPPPSSSSLQSQESKSVSAVGTQSNPVNGGASPVTDSSTSRANDDEDALLSNGDVLKAMKSAWKRAGIGTRNTEAGFLVFHTDDGLRTVKLPNTNEPDRISFDVTELRKKAKLSDSARLVAVFHTHPSNRSHEPSVGETSGDNVTAKSLKVPVYVMHKRGLSSVLRTGEKKLFIRRDLDWLK